MSARKGKTNIKLATLNEINQIDRRLKRVKNNEEETSKLMSQRNKLREKLKTNRKLLENIRKYDEKEKTKQSKSQILGQKLVKRTTNKEKNTRLYN